VVYRQSCLDVGLDNNLEPLEIHQRGFPHYCKSRFLKLKRDQFRLSLVRAFGKRFSNWWLLVLTPIAFIALPILLTGFFMANNLAGAMFGPPAIWNRTWQVPPRTDLVGSYVESERNLDDNSPFAAASLTLQADGSMIVANLPANFGESPCTLAGTGSWKGPDDDGIGLTVVSDLNPGSCQSGYYTGLELAGHSNPYRLYWIVGDPDSGTGVWLRKR
jgi:hypothetical protein